MAVGDGLLQWQLPIWFTPANVIVVKTTMWLAVGMFLYSGKFGYACEPSIAMVIIGDIWHRRLVRFSFRQLFFACDRRCNALASPAFF
jgi:hypothetical protein